jgi:hypothetical protein
MKYRNVLAVLVERASSTNRRAEADRLAIYILSSRFVETIPRKVCSLKMIYHQNVTVPNIEVHEHRDCIVLLRCLTQGFVAVGSTETLRVERGM